MKTEYFFIIVYLVCLVYVIFRARLPINEVWNGVITLKKEDEEKKNEARKSIRKESLKLLLYFFCGLICVVSSIFAWKHIKGPADPGEQGSGLSEEENIEYQEIKNKIVFDNEIINEDTTIWGQILTKKLGADDLEISSEDAIDIEKLRNDISQSIYGNEMSWDELKRFILDFKETGIFPDTGRTVEEINADITEMKEKIDNKEELPDELNPETLYSEEFFARFNRYQKSPVIENLYQITRAADDAYKQLFTSKDAESKKKVLFFATVTSNLYKIYVAECDRKNKSYEVDLSFIEYRLSELYIYLYRYYCTEKENESIRLCFILKADAHLEKAEQNFIHEHIDEDINGYLSYYDAYYAEIFYCYYTKTDDIQYAEKCCEYSNRYLASEYARENEKSSCYDYLEKIEKARIRP